MRWFGACEEERRCKNVLVRRCERLEIVGTRRDRGRPKIYMGETNIGQGAASTYRGHDLKYDGVKVMD